MDSIIKIPGNNTAITMLPSLKELLVAVKPLGDTLKWSVMGQLWSLGRLPYQPALKKRLLDKEFAKPQGLVLSWEELVQYADAVQQVIDGIFVGFDKESTLPNHTYIYADAELYSRSRIVLEVRDSSFWLIYLTDDSLGSKMVEQYNAELEPIKRGD